MLALALLLGSGPPLNAQAPEGATALRPLGSPAWQFRLSRSPDFASEDRAFSTGDTLYMWIETPAIEALLGTWRLQGSSETITGQLGPAQDGLGASFSLADMSGGAATWVWSTDVTWRGYPLATVAAELTLVPPPPPPVADFTASTTSGELPLPVAFSDLSQGLVTSWSWDFGDGTRSSEASPTHVYPEVGTYSVSLAVSNPSASDTRTAPDLVTVRDSQFAILYGMNASENTWAQRGIAFADAMARASELCRIVNGTITRFPAPLLPLGQQPPVLGAGWPDVSALAAGEKVGARLFGNMKGTMPDGREVPYVVTWEGTGSCLLTGLAVIGETHRSAQRVEVFVDPTAIDGDTLLAFVIDSSSPADPVRDAHVWLPGMETEKPILWPRFVEKLAAMNGGRGPYAWRAMDWNEVNQYGRNDGAAPFVFTLNERITPASVSQGTRRGVCPEFQVALCNAVGANLHFNVPHAANGLSDADYEAFLRAQFTAIRDGSPAVPGVNGGRPFAPLAPQRVVTVEFSNEVWNPTFPVHDWVKARALESGRNFYQQAAFEIRRVFRVAGEVFTGADAPRLRRYVGGSLGNPSYLLEVLSALGPDEQIDAVGPACYFGPRKEESDKWAVDARPGSCPNCPTPDAVVESARLRIQELDLKLLEHRLIADSHLNRDGSRPKLELYEGGAAFTAGFAPWSTAASQAQKLPSMYDAYVLDFIPALVTRGVDAVMWYSFISDGSAQGGGAGPFGHWDNMDQSITLPVPDVYVDEGAPKAAAIYRLPPRRNP